MVNGNDTGAGRDPLGIVLRGAVLGYRYSFAYFFRGHCRHLPTCSEYALEALRRHGGWRGGWLALARISRCRPGGSHGFDPVPVTLSRHPWWQGWRYGQWGPGSDSESKIDSNPL